MSFVRNLYADLMEKRLWPVALGLLVALVAIPVLLAKPAGESASTGTPPTDNALLGADSAALIGETKAVVTVGSDGGFRQASSASIERTRSSSRRPTRRARRAMVQPSRPATPPVPPPRQARRPQARRRLPAAKSRSRSTGGWRRSSSARSTRPSRSRSPQASSCRREQPVLFLGADESGKNAQFLVSAEATPRRRHLRAKRVELSDRSARQGRHPVLRGFPIGRDGRHVRAELTDIALEEVKDANVAAQRRVPRRTNEEPSFARSARRCARSVSSRRSTTSGSRRRYRRRPSPRRTGNEGGTAWCCGTGHHGPGRMGNEGVTHWPRGAPRVPALAGPTLDFRLECTDWLRADWFVGELCVL